MRANPTRRASAVACRSNRYRRKTASGAICMVSKFEVFKQIVRSVAAAQAHHGAGIRISESRVQIGDRFFGVPAKYSGPHVRALGPSLAANPRPRKAAMPRSTRSGLRVRGRRDDADGSVRRDAAAASTRSPSHHASPRAMSEAGPVRLSSIPGPSQVTTCDPPGANTVSGETQRRKASAAVAAAEVPVPEDVVGPTPRSKMRTSISCSLSDADKFGVCLVGKIAMRADFGADALPGSARNSEICIFNQDDESADCRPKLPSR